MHRFGRGRITRRMRLAEAVQAGIYRGGWPAVLGRRLGVQGVPQTSEHDFTVRRKAGHARALRVAFGSDWHAGPLTHHDTLERGCELIASARADVLFLGGDFTAFRARYINDLIRLLAPIVPPLGAYAVLGNHDLMVEDRYVVTRLEAAGVQVLINQSVRLAEPHDDVWVCGLDDAEAGEPDVNGMLQDTDGVRLILAHSPEAIPLLKPHDFAVAFCGHTHGGQAKLPGGRWLVSPRGEQNRRYLRGGVFELPARDGSARKVLVSRGIGCTVLPIRRGADPEIHLCRIVGD